MTATTRSRAVRGTTISMAVPETTSSRRRERRLYRRRSRQRPPLRGPRCARTVFGDEGDDKSMAATASRAPRRRGERHDLRGRRTDVVFGETATTISRAATASTRWGRRRQRLAPGRRRRRPPPGQGGQRPARRRHGSGGQRRRPVIGEGGLDFGPGPGRHTASTSPPTRRQHRHRGRPGDEQPNGTGGLLDT